jgi:hypothetical protein
MRRVVHCGAADTGSHSSLTLPDLDARDTATGTSEHKQIAALGSTHLLCRDYFLTSGHTPSVNGLKASLPRMTAFTV